MESVMYAIIMAYVLTWESPMESVMYANHGVRTHLGESHGVSDVR